MDGGGLVPDEVVIGIIKERLKMMIVRMDLFLMDSQELCTSPGAGRNGRQYR